jgi:L-lactate utilization protein LutB
VVFQIKEFESFQEIEKALDREISETKSRLGKSLQRLDEIRSLAEKTKRIRQVVSKLAGKKAVEESSSEVSVDGFSVVLDANPLDELTVLETVVRSHQEFLMSLQKIREGLRTLAELGDSEGMTFLVVENKGVPEKILLKIA